MMGQRLEQGPSSKDWLVWQLVDSLLPTGGFAHSLGVEVSCHLCACVGLTFMVLLAFFPCLRPYGLCEQERAKTKVAASGGFCRSLKAEPHFICSFFRFCDFRFQALDKHVARSSFRKSSAHLRKSSPLQADSYIAVLS
jgi:hypothetical protein